MEFLWDLLHRIYDVESIVRTGGLVALIVIVLVETGILVGFFLPGDSLLVTAGFFAARVDLDLLTLNTTLSLAAIAGDSVGYGIGARTGPKIFTREDSLFFNRKHLISAKVFYDRYGGFTIFIARFMPIIRTFAPVVAGVEIGRASCRERVTSRGGGVAVRGKSGDNVQHAVQTHC